MKTKTAVLGATLLLSAAQPAFPWGDDGHKTVALIAQQCLTPDVKKKVTAMLAADTDNLTQHDIASEATWADKYRDSNHRKDHYEQTQNWHFTDMEIDKPDLISACFGRPALPAGTLASDGPAKDCAVDKIEQFQAELAAPGTDAEERLFALKFILHFVGDLHQPLHSSDNHDRGGNEVNVTVAGFPHKSKDELHGFWDTQFVDGIATPPTALAKKLLAQIQPSDASTWATGSPEDWQKEAFAVAKADSYDLPPLSQDKTEHLSASYVTKAEKDVSLQLSRAGIRLASVLNKSLGSEDADWASCLGANQQQQQQQKTRTSRHRRRSH
jgi:S1/P1 Nuclease